VVSGKGDARAGGLKRCVEGPARKVSKSNGCEALMLGRRDTVDGRALGDDGGSACRRGAGAGRGDPLILGRRRSALVDLRSALYW
jgi:hypothetical protein